METENQRLQAGLLRTYRHFSIFCIPAILVQSANTWYYRHFHYIEKKTDCKSLSGVFTFFEYLEFNSRFSGWFL